MRRPIVGRMTARDADVPASVLTAFGIAEGAQALPGGQGKSVVAGGLVLKPDAEVAETAWLAGVCSRVKPHGFRLPAPVPAIDGRLVVDGWSAVPYVLGAPVDQRDHAASVWLAVLDVSRALHRAVRQEQRPAFLDNRAHRWARADGFAWEVGRSAHAPGAERLVATLRHCLVDEGLDNQLVHGDLSGNVLLDEAQTPAVIDFSPYWRPAGYADAVVVVDALLWWRADPALRELGQPVDLAPDVWTSLLARAVIFRLLASADVDEEQDEYERVVRLLSGP